MVWIRCECTSPVNVVFTNLSHDHLDWHGNMNSYFEAKTKLFTEIFSMAELRVINIDEWGASLSKAEKIEISCCGQLASKTGLDFQILKAEPAFG